MRKIDNLVCWGCGRSLDDLPQPLGRRDVCPGCGAELHVCRLCQSYDTRVANACREPLEDTPADKSRSNYCDLFVPRPEAYQGAGDGREQRSRAQLETLFGMEPGSSDRGSEAARKGLSDLFGDED